MSLDLVWCQGSQKTLSQELHSATDLLCDLGESLTLSGPLFPFLLYSIRSYGHGYGRCQGICPALPLGSCEDFSELLKFLSLSFLFCTYFTGVFQGGNKPDSGT